MSPTGHEWSSDSSTPPSGDIWDLLVIGGGTAGIVASKTAASLGATVLMVEGDRTGGDCLWTGCVPSKALLAAAHAAESARCASRLGIDVGGVKVNFSRVIGHVTDSISAIEPVDSPLAMRASGICVVRADVHMTGKNSADVNGETVRFRQAVIATGSAPVIPKISGLSSVVPLTSDNVWSLTALPERLLVMGGGSIGCELGQAFARLGSNVTIVEEAPRLLPNEDPDASRLLFESLSIDGIDVRTGVAINRFDSQGGHNFAVLEDSTQVPFDRVLIAVGRRPRTGALQLGASGVEVDDKGYVRVDSRLRTTNRRIWAAGDVTGHPQFTHTAGVHGSLAASNALLGLRRKAELTTIPRVTYTQPEVASFGVAASCAQGSNLSMKTIHHDEVDRAVAEQETHGFSRIVLDHRGRLVGAVLVGPRAGESLAEAVLAARHGLRARDIAGTMHAYPTYGDGLWKAALASVQDELRRPLATRLIGLLRAVRQLFLLGR